MHQILNILLQPSDVRPYSEYIVEVIAEGYETVLIRGTQIFPAVEAIQNVPIGSPSTTSRKSRKDKLKLFMI